ncbi:MAG: hypothetical protein ACYDH9_14845 [Limisphaerales bacterium]
MNEIKHGHSAHGDQNGGSNHSDHRPYWKRAHRSWPFWIAVFLMLAAMLIYVMSDDLAGWHRGKSRQPLAGSVGN